MNDTQSDTAIDTRLLAPHDRHPQIMAAQEPLRLDVRPLFARGETPCAAIDAAMAQTQTGQTLVLLVPFEPVPLYARFRNAGFRHQTRAEDDGTWQIEFFREFTPATPATPAPACGCGH